MTILGFCWQMHTDQYDRYVSRGVYASNMLVQRLDGAVAVVVCDGEDEHVTVRPVDGPGSEVITEMFQHGRICF